MQAREAWPNLYTTGDAPGIFMVLGRWKGYTLDRDDTGPIFCTQDGITVGRVITLQDREAICQSVCTLGNIAVERVIYLAKQRG